MGCRSVQTCMRLLSKSEELCCDMPLSDDLKGLPLLDPSFFVTLPRLSATSLFCTHHAAVFWLKYSISLLFLSVYRSNALSVNEAYSYVNAEQCR